MQALATRREWVHRLGLPVVAVLVVSVLWSGFATALAHLSLGVSTRVNGRPLSFAETALVYTPQAGQFVAAVNLLVLITLITLRRGFRWWVILVGLAVVGVPVVLVVSRLYFQHVRALGRGAGMWEAAVPAAGMVAVWMLGLLVDAVLDRVARGRRRRRAASGHCPQCGYDLRGQLAAGTRVCSECGAPIDLAAQNGGGH